MWSIEAIIQQVTARPTRLQVLLVVTLIWAGIYLPGLGSVELKHEEPRRALPAVHMLATGDWLVPRVGSVAYLRKPPLLNWLIAGAFTLTGGRSEWAVRLPSVLATLALALAVVIFGRRWIGLPGALIASILLLTNLAILESGRLAELEAVYIAFTGIALVIWLSLWRNGAAGMRLWFWPTIFLALGLLTKGPTHFIFFYGVIIPVLAFAKDLRVLLRPSHWIALLLMLALFSLWAIPCSLAVGQHKPLAVWQFWTREITSRASGGEVFRLQQWLLNFPQTLKNFLPWTPLLILLWTSGSERTRGDGTVSDSTNEEVRDRAIFNGARLGMVVTCLLMCLLPSGSPRYIYPLFVVPCLLLGQIFARARNDRLELVTLKWWHWINALLLVVSGIAVLSIPFFADANLGSVLSFVLGIGIVWCGLDALRLDRAGREPVERATAAALTTGIVFVTAMVTYSAAIVPRVNAMSTDGARETAAVIRKATPADAILWVQENEYRPFWYYLEPDVKYFVNVKEIPATARYFLLPEQEATAFSGDARWSNQHLETLARVVDGEKKAFLVLGLR